MNGTDQNQDMQAGGTTAIGTNNDAFNFKNAELNRFLKIFNAKLTFTYGQRQVSAEIIQAKRMDINIIEIACRDGELRYDIELNLKTRQARVLRVYPLKPAIKV